MNAAVLHAVVAVCGIAAYTVLSALHIDGNAVLVAAVGYGSGALIQKGTGAGS